MKKERSERANKRITIVHILFVICSYLALLLLLTVPTVLGLIVTFVFFGVGTILFIWKKLWLKIKLPSIISFFLSSLFLCYFGFTFYNNWLASSKFQAIASLLHIPNDLLILLTVVALAVCALYSASCIFHHIIIFLITNKNVKKADFFLCITTAFLTVLLAQYMIDVKLFSMGRVKLLVGATIVSIAILIIYSLSGKMLLSITLGSLLFMVFSTVNAYVFRFRGRLFEPLDFFSIGTAMDVSSNYSLVPIPNKILIGWGIWIVFITFAIIWKKRRIQEKLFFSWKQRISLCLLCFISIICVSSYAFNLPTYHWKEEGAEQHGCILDFFVKIKYINVPKPDNYSTEDIQSLSEHYTIPSSQESAPHIIVIMDEAFSDLSVLGNLLTNIEVTPFVSSLKENAISGYALASVYGGNTANSEYEFLTGNSMAWLSPNAVPYQQYIKSPSYSIVSHLKTYYQYRCISMFPHSSSGWNRPAVYAQFGFDESYFMKDFPQEHYIREYISDQELFESIIDTYEKQKDSPLFLFGVSMQNHGDYYYEGDNYKKTVSLVGYDKEYPDVEQYLSLVRESDKAVEYLISYFENADENVVVVFFGDHQPRLNDDFYNEICNGNLDALTEQQNRHKVPFFVWANYEIEEKFVECTSLNYLSTYMYEVAGLSLPVYNQFLSEMENEISAINAYGFYSKYAQSFLPFDMASEEEQKWLQQYQCLQYNNIVDTKKRNHKFFPVLD